jgi:hypothetical protein
MPVSGSPPGQVAVVGVDAGEQARVDRSGTVGHGGEDLVVDRAAAPLAGGDDLQALAAHCRRQPGSYPLGVAQPWQVLDQAQPGDLDHIGGVGPLEAVAAGHGPEQVGVAVDKGVPRGLVAVGGSLDQAADVLV